LAFRTHSFSIKSLSAAPAGACTAPWLDAPLVVSGGGGPLVTGTVGPGLVTGSMVGSGDSEGKSVDCD
jgi:hypothetical protein